MPDQNGAWEDGVMPVPTSIDENDRRVSCAMAYLTPAVRARKNLTIRTETFVRRILFTGARASRRGDRARRARREIVQGREIILTCGAIHSPAVLMRSGVGAPDELAKHGIGIVAPLPGVGRNLIEHPSVSVSCYLGRAAACTISTAITRRRRCASPRASPGCPAGDMCIAVLARSGWHALGPARRLALFLRQQGLLARVGHLALGRSARGAAGRFPHAVRPARSRTAAQRVPLRRRDRGGAGARRHPQQDLPDQLFGPRARRFGAGLRNAMQMSVLAGMLGALPMLRGWLIDTLVTSGVTLADVLADDATLDAYLKKIGRGRVASGRELPHGPRRRSARGDDAHGPRARRRRACASAMPR